MKKKRKITDQAAFWIDHLKLEKHPEGGYFREAYRSEEIIKKGSLPQRFSGDRSFSSSIYFLLKEDEYSGFHRIRSDETWHFYKGNPVEIYIIQDEGGIDCLVLGDEIEKGQQFQLTVKYGQWFAAKPINSKGFSLIGCTVAPGFHFEDFELATEEELIRQYPDHSEIIKKLCVK